MSVLYGDEPIELRVYPNSEPSVSIWVSRYPHLPIGAFERTGVGVPDDPAELRLKAEACRRLAGMFEEPERKALWIERAGQWEQLAIKAEKQPSAET